MIVLNMAIFRLLHPPVEANMAHHPSLHPQGRHFLSYIYLCATALGRLSKRSCQTSSTPWHYSSVIAFTCVFISTQVCLHCTHVSCTSPSYTGKGSCQTGLVHARNPSAYWISMCTSRWDVSPWKFLAAGNSSGQRDLSLTWNTLSTPVDRMR